MTQSSPAPSRRARGPRGSLLLGSLGAYKRDPVAFFAALGAQYGDLARFRLGPYPTYLVTHPDGIRHVVQLNDANYCRGRFYEKFKIFFGRGLLTLDGEDWRAHRAVAQPAFLRTVLTRSTRHVVAATEDLLDRWEVAASAGEPVNLLPECMAVTLGSLSRTLFGLDVSDGRTEILRAVDFGVQAMFNRGRVDEYLPSWLPTARNRGIARHRAVLEGVVERVRAEHRAEEAAVDLVSLLEGATDPETGKPWSAREVLDELTTVFLAGQETTAVALCWTLYAVARSPQVRERLQAEVDALSGAHPAQDLDRLPYTGMVIQESLRLRPPIWIYTRDAVGPDEILGHPIEPGASVIVSPYVTHRRPDLWPDPEKFDPDRFDPQTRSARARFAYFPFGGGPRQCIGMHLALHELQVMLAMITQRFGWSLVDDDPVGVGELVLSLRPVRDVAVRLTPRSVVGGVPSAA